MNDKYIVNDDTMAALKAERAAAELVVGERQADLDLAKADLKAVQDKIKVCKRQEITRKIAEKLKEVGEDFPTHYCSVCKKKVRVEQNGKEYCCPHCGNDLWFYHTSAPKYLAQLPLTCFECQGTGTRINDLGSHPEHYTEHKCSRCQGTGIDVIQDRHHSPEEVMTDERIIELGGTP